MDKLVSIITPCYNGEKYVKPFLQSVLDQNYLNIELIFVDDGSTDNTKIIVDSYKPLFEKKGYKLIYIYQENAGQAAAVNQGLKIFQGEFLMWVDSDDIMLPDNTKDKVQYLESHNDCGFVIGKGQFVNAEQLEAPYGILQRVPPQNPVEDNLFEDLIMERNVVFCPGVIMTRREAIIKSIPTLHIFESREGQNWQLMLPLAYHYKCGYLDKVVFHCVVHSDSHSRCKRNIRQQIERFENFETLLTETVRSIPQMANEEKNRFYSMIHEKYVFRKLEMYQRHLCIIRSHNLIKEIKSNGYSMCPYDNTFEYWVKKVKRKLFR